MPDLHKKVSVQLPEYRLIGWLVNIEPMTITIVDDWGVEEICWRHTIVEIEEEK
jgi:hypothetical protein